MKESSKSICFAKHPHVIMFCRSCSLLSYAAAATNDDAAGRSELGSPFDISHPRFLIPVNKFNDSCLSLAGHCARLLH